MIIGTHSIIYSRNATADRAFLAHVLELSGVDIGDGWVIFALPPSEVAVHPATTNNRHELYFLCEDIESFVDRMRGLQVPVTKVQQQSWGYLTSVRMPGGGRIRVYQPLHKRPKALATSPGCRKPKTIVAQADFKFTKTRKDKRSSIRKKPSEGR